MPKTQHHISPAIRAAFLESLKVIQRRTGKPFSEILADKLEEDLLGTLNAVSKFNVREKESTITVKDEREYSATELASRILAAVGSKEAQAIVESLTDEDMGSATGTTDPSVQH